MIRPGVRPMATTGTGTTATETIGMGGMGKDPATEAQATGTHRHSLAARRGQSRRTQIHGLARPRRHKARRVGTRQDPPRAPRTARV